MRHRLVDLSLPTTTVGVDFGMPAKMTLTTHEDRGRIAAEANGISLEDLGGGANALEEFSYIHPHWGTHMDAPLHYTPTVREEPSPTIDQIPLEWCFGDGVVLDVSYKKPGEDIAAEDLQRACDAIRYEIKPGDIVLIRTGTPFVRSGKPGYDMLNPGVTRDGTLWLGDRGVRVVGIDAYCYDRPPQMMIDEIKAGVKGKYMQGHRAAGERGMCIIEWLTNLDAIPPFGFKVCAFPTKVEGGTAGWTRVVALVDERED